MSVFSNVSSMSQIIKARIGIVGANYAGLSAAAKLVSLFGTKEHEDSDVKITLFDKKDGFLHLIGMTHGLVHTSFAPKLWVNHDEISWSKSDLIQFCKGRVSSIHKNHLIVDEKVESPFDYLIIATGFSRSPPIWPTASSCKDYLQEVGGWSNSICKSDSVVVVGGGAVGTEMAADVKSEYPSKEVILIHSRDTLIPGPFTNVFKERAHQELRELGVDVILGERVIDETSTKNGIKSSVILTTNKGRKIETNLVIHCTGKGKAASDMVHLPPTTSTPLVDDNCNLRVQDTLQLIDPAYPHIFAVGDVNDIPVVKLAGAAISQGAYAAENIHKLIMSRNLSTKLSKYQGPKPYMCLVLGRHRQVSQDTDGEIGGAEFTTKLRHGNLEIYRIIGAMN
ncbi:hypothetical protein K7432_000696 [Basidiobolus ranarum]|uniref:FAD/NAD(P)-binding domain-containing protein n=1 Tax=Basidiobolus ranarum TaxID=34480 RepID=A0ABR2X422_9FUNG